MVTRETLPDGSVRLSAGTCSFLYSRPRPGVTLIRINGVDSGQFGSAALEELREDLKLYAPVELFVDTGTSASANLPVQETWTAWFRAHRSELKSVSILVRSSYMHFTAEVAKLFSRTGELIRVYLEPKPFREALLRAAPECDYDPER